MNKFEVNIFRGAGKTTNAIAVALTFASCGKKVDYLVHHPSMVSIVKNIIKNKYGISGNPVSLWCIGGYVPDADTDVVICDECSFPTYGWDAPNLTVIEYNTPKELEVFANSIPNFMNIYTKFIMGKISFKEPSFEKPKKPMNEFTQHIKDTMEALDCSVIVALEVIKAERELL